MYVCEYKLFGHAGARITLFALGVFTQTPQSKIHYRLPYSVPCAHGTQSPTVCCCRTATGALTPDVAVYFITFQDADGAPLTGVNSTNYTVTFSNPLPAKFLWSLSIYQASNGFMIVNPIKRASVGQNTAGLQYNADGSLTVYISAAAPGAYGTLPYTNWLPSGPYPVSLVLRLYGPSADAVAGQWQPPPIMKVK